MGVRDLRSEGASTPHGSGSHGRGGRGHSGLWRPLGISSWRDRVQARRVTRDARRVARRGCVLLDGQEKLELRRELLLGVEAVREIDAADAAVRVNLHAERLDVVGAVCTTREVAEVELDLVPSLIQAHWHRANERFDACRRLVVRGAESASDVFVVEHLHLEGEVLLEVLDDHHQKRQLERLDEIGTIEGRRGGRRKGGRLGGADLDAESALGVRRARDVIGAHVRAHNLSWRKSARREQGREGS